MPTLDSTISALDRIVREALSFNQQHPSSIDSYVNYRVAKALRDVFRAMQQPHDSTPDPNIHVVHYTSIRALFSMLTGHAQPPSAGSRYTASGFLRLYDASHFNDPEEGLYFFRQLTNHTANGAAAGAEHALLTQLIDRLNADDPSATRAPLGYIASFVISSTPVHHSTSDTPPAIDNRADNLVLWRLYGDQGRGCSLSIPTTAFAHSSLTLRNVLYGPKPVLDNLAPFLRALRALRPLFSATPTTHRLLTDTILDSLSTLRYLYKDSGYAYEHECRLVAFESDLLQSPNCLRCEYQSYASTHGDLRLFGQHSDLQTDNLLISGSTITLGPCVPHYHHLARAITKLFHDANIGVPPIRRSAAPYRQP